MTQDFNFLQDYQDFLIHVTNRKQLLWGYQDVPVMQNQFADLLASGFEDMIISFLKIEGRRISHWFCTFFESGVWYKLAICLKLLLQGPVTL